MSSRSHAALLPASLLAALLAFAAPAQAADVTVTLDAGSGFVVEDNTATIERLRVDEATGNVSRNGALFVHTTGGGNDVFVGPFAGNTSITGQGNSGFGAGPLFNLTTGYFNSAFGLSALSQNMSGSENSAFGVDALLFNTIGSRNSAFGRGALYSSTVATYNSAFGKDSLRSNTFGSNNSGFGSDALRSNTGGASNSAFGRDALASNTNGIRNVGVGRSAGSNLTSGSHNIYIANDGLSTESGRIKIGNPNHTEAFIEGIMGNTANGGVTVLINSANELHTAVSSARFKQAVRDMGEASEVLMKLRPVTFRYREEVADGANVPEYGLIAEEVAGVAPELVAYDGDGEPYSVRYHVLPSLLLNEMQKQQQTIETLLQSNAVLVARLDALESGSLATR